MSQNDKRAAQDGDGDLPPFDLPMAPNAAAPRAQGLERAHGSDAEQSHDAFNDAPPERRSISERARASAMPPYLNGLNPEQRAAVEALDGPNEPDVALLDEIEKGQPSVRVVLGNGDDEPKIRLNHSVLRRRAAIVDDAPTKVPLLFSREEWNMVDFAQVQLQFCLDSAR